MARSKRYSLMFLFDGAQITKSDLEQKIGQVLGEHQNAIDVITTELDNDRLQLSMIGKLRDIDACHNIINKEVFDRRYAIRLIDEAGDQIRESAYPIIAEIETALRTFINRSMVEIMGSNWWIQVCPKEIQGQVNDREKKLSDNEKTLIHPVELTLFEELITIVTGSLQEWKENKNLSVKDFLEIITDCQTIEQVRDKLNEKIEFSIWNKVFVHYFEDRAQWEQFRKDIETVVIPIRNRVMHHRPVQYADIEKLRKVRKQMLALIGSAKPELSKEELYRARKDSNEYVSEVTQKEFASEVARNLATTAPFAGVDIAGIATGRTIAENVMRNFTGGAIAENAMRSLTGGTIVDNAIRSLTGSTIANDFIKASAIGEFFKTNDPAWMREITKGIDTSLWEGASKTLAEAMRPNMIDIITKGIDTSFWEGINKNLVETIGPSVAEIIAKGLTTPLDEISKNITLDSRPIDLAHTPPKAELNDAEDEDIDTDD